MLPAYASPMPCDPSRREPAGEAYILSRETFSRLAAIKVNTYTEAIPKRRLFGIALFCPFFHTIFKSIWFQARMRRRDFWYQGGGGGLL